MGLAGKAGELAEALKATSEFAALRQARAVIDKNGGLKAQVEDLKRKQMTLYSGRLSQKESETRMAEIDGIYGRMSGVPEIKAYFDAADRFNRLLSDTYKQIGQLIEGSL